MHHRTQCVPLLRKRFPNKYFLSYACVAMWVWVRLGFICKIPWSMSCSLSNQPLYCFVIYTTLWCFFYSPMGGGRVGRLMFMILVFYFFVCFCFSNFIKYCIIYLAHFNAELFVFEVIPLLIHSSLIIFQHRLSFNRNAFWFHLSWWGK